ncbi:NAD-dependent epimerase/dehydratase family protein [Candidatus Woesearchaeota archaeon]|nr:NAD-dependent epimerase/dehydratase family protein [Candidatus Woesearchaeota archaeon]
MNILVTGGAGFIGSHIVDLLVKENKVIIIDNLSSGQKENINKKAIFYEQDLSNFKEVEDIIKKENIEIIYHLAAQMDVRKSVELPIFDAQQNIINTLNLLEVSIKYKIKHFIFSSSGGAIYGDTNVPTTEEARELPVSPYGVAKLSIEKYLNYYHKIHNLKYTALRYANVYGSRQNQKGEAGVVSIFFTRMLRNEPISIFGGKQTRDFVFVEDVARANLLALTDKESNTYNIGTEKETNIIELFNEINKFFNNKFSPIYEKSKLGEQMKSCLSYQKISKQLNWQPKINLEEGLKKTYEFYKFLKDSNNS